MTINGKLVCYVCKQPLVQLFAGDPVFSQWGCPDEMDAEHQYAYRLTNPDGTIRETLA